MSLVQLSIPSWVPAPVAQHVNDRLAAETDHTYESLREGSYPDPAFVQEELAERAADYRPLVCDVRMKCVWRELSRHPALSGDQDAALVDLFNTALTCRVRCVVTRTRSELEQERDRSLAKATELKQDAARMNWEHFKTLLAAAQAYEDSAREIYTSNIAMAGERQRDGRARWVALTIAEKFCARFGLPMYKLTAIITSVVLDRDINPSAVRYWCGALAPPCS
jgi:hypothetical protein